MLETSCPLEPAERAQFDAMLDDNLDLVLEMLSAMRDESSLAADGTTSAFLAGVTQVMHAFATLRDYQRSSPTRLTLFR
jgi:hypothetical protein